GKRGEPIAVELDRAADWLRDGLRLAVGLRGCDLPVIIYAQRPRPWDTVAELIATYPDAREYGEAWLALDSALGEARIPELSDEDPGVVLRL
ncbi:MAG: hypothetical protein HQL73_14240, partial [Magnetococcales bacterium]|nr:hypothetical protein [Magnetococcales bacterium]